MVFPGGENGISHEQSNGEEIYISQIIEWING